MTTRKQLDALCNVYARTVLQACGMVEAPTPAPSAAACMLAEQARMQAEAEALQAAGYTPRDAQQAARLAAVERAAVGALAVFNAEQPAEVEQAAEQAVDTAAMHEACALLQQVDTLLCGPSDSVITAEYEPEYNGYCVWCDANRADGLWGCDMSDHGLTPAEAACYAVSYTCSQIVNTLCDSTDAACLYGLCDKAWSLAWDGYAVEAVQTLRAAVEYVELLQAAQLCSLCAGGIVTVEHGLQGYTVETALDGIEAEGMTAAECMQCLCSLAHDCGLGLCAGGSACNSYQRLYEAVEAHVLQLAALDPVTAYVESFNAELLEAADLVRRGHSVYDALQFVEP